MKNKLGLMLSTLGAALTSGDMPYGYQANKTSYHPGSPSGSPQLLTGKRVGGVFAKRKIWKRNVKRLSFPGAKGRKTP